MTRIRDTLERALVTSPPPGEVPNTADVPLEETPDYTSLLLADLKAEAAARNLHVSGTKAEIIQRLEADDA